jgi:hypothetical protein
VIGYSPTSSVIKIIFSHVYLSRQDYKSM